MLFEIFNQLNAGIKQKWFAKPAEVGIRRVCALSGMLPGPYCPETKTELYIYNFSPNRVCTFHQKYEIDDQTGYQLCSFCRQGKKHHSQIFVKWPQEVANWMKANHLYIEEIPAHLPSCPHQASGHKPNIISPASDDYFLLRPGIDRVQQQVPLRASVDNLVKTIYWFIDGRLFWEGPAEQTVFYLPTPGRHQLTCIDQEGRQTSISFTVLTLEAPFSDRD